MGLLSLLLAYFDKLFLSPPSTTCFVTHAGNSGSVDQNTHFCVSRIGIAFAQNKVNAFHILCIFISK